MCTIERIVLYVLLLCMYLLAILQLVQYIHSAIVILTSDSAQVVRILELTLNDEGDVTTKVNGECMEVINVTDYIIIIIYNYSNRCSF